MLCPPPKSAAAFLFVLLLFCPVWAFSQSLSKALDQKLEEQYGPGFHFEKMLTMEKVGKEAHFASEISILGKNTLRIPAKLHHSKEGWKVNWLPKKEYLVALDNLSTSKILLPKFTKSWTDEKRLPTFPILLTAQRTITPFGEIKEEEKGSKHPMLTQYGRRWIRAFLEEDPAPATFEIITTKDIMWGSIHPIMFQMAGVLGLFQMYLVGGGEGEFSSILLRTTVGTKMPTRVISLTLPEKGKFKLRVKEGSTLESFQKDCLSIQCTDFSTSIPQITASLFQRPLGEEERVIIGFSKEVTLDQVSHLLGALMAKLKIKKSERFLVTLVEE